MKNDFLQNMAPNAKRSVIVTLVLGALATALYMFAVEPFGQQLDEQQKKLEGLESEQARINNDLKRAPTIKSDLAELDKKLEPYKAALLTPLLESYAMRAKSILDPLLLGAGLIDLEYTDEPFRALPVPAPIPRQLYTRAAIRVTARGSYQSAISFLLRLENEYPLISLQTFEINVQQIPSRQSVSYVLEWPALGKLTRP